MKSSPPRNGAALHDLGGFSLLGVGAIAWFGWKPVARKLIRWKLGPYRVTVNKVDPALALKLSATKRVGVLGGGLAGIAASGGPRWARAATR